MTVIESQVDIAENIVYRWYSITRHLHISNPNAINSLRTNLVHTLVSEYNQNDDVANRIVIDHLLQWIDKNDNHSVQSDKAIDTLIELVQEILKKA